VHSREKVPGSVLALLLGLGLAVGVTACGGDAESAGDLDSTPYVEGWDAEDAAPDAAPGMEAAPPAAAPPAQAPRPGATAPDRSSTVAPPPPDAVISDPTPAPDPELLPEPTGTVLPIGTEMTGTLESGLSTRTSQQGDVFHARLGEALRAVDGTVLIPAGSRLEGRVVESRESPSAEEPAALLLAIESLVVDGVRYPIQATVLRTEVATEARDSGQRTAATIATGAAAGAVVGRILGRDTRSTVAGAAVGAAAGAGIALTTRDGHATLDEGARITVRLESPVIVAQR
jgi:hypothetical protein